jgi:hypothetical protein
LCLVQISMFNTANSVSARYNANLVEGHVVTAATRTTTICLKKYH